MKNLKLIFSIERESLLGTNDVRSNFLFLNITYFNSVPTPQTQINNCFYKYKNFEPMNKNLELNKYGFKFKVNSLFILCFIDLYQA